MNILYDLEAQIPITDVPNSGISGIADQLSNALDFWKGKTETDSSVYSRLQELWDQVPGIAWTPATVPWSAVWVSKMINGVGNFTPRAAHYQYLEDAIKGNSEWVPISLIKQPDTVLNPGDIVLFPRGSASSPAQSEYYYTHGDIVFQGGDKASEIVTVGGNLGDRVKVSKRLEATEGIPKNPSPYVVVLKKRKSSMIVPIVIGVGIAGLIAWIIQRKK